jgi:hypothetical protein
MISIGSLFIGLAMLIAAVPFVIQPLTGRKAALKLKPISRRDKLIQDRSRVMTALRDLDFDHQIGKVAEEDHKALRERLLLEAAGTMTEIEKDDRELEESIAARKAMKISERSADKYCYACGSRLEPEDIYCTHCGSKTR